MKELLKASDPVLLSWVVATLAAEGIEAVVFDAHTSILQGTTNAIPRRVMVAEEDHGRARRLLADSGELPAETT